MSLRLPTIRFAPANKLTGRRVLAMLVAFFGFVMVVNFAMMEAAISTFGGVDTKSSYEAGRVFETEVARAAAQQERQWNVVEHVTPSGDEQVLSLELRDADGSPVTGVDVQAKFAHPVDERRDVVVALSETGPGTFHGKGLVSPGVWQLDLIVSRSGEQLFRSQNRIIVP